MNWDAQILDQNVAAAIVIAYRLLAEHGIEPWCYHRANAWG